MKKIAIFCLLGCALTLSAQTVGKTLDELAKQAQEKSTSSTSSGTSLLHGLTDKKVSDKQLEKQAKEAEAKTKSEAQSTLEDASKDSKKKISGFKTISERFAEFSGAPLERETTSDPAETKIDLVDKPSGKSKAQPPKSISERFAEATTRYAGYDSHAKAEIASGAKVATDVKREKPNNLHLTPISGIVFGAEISTLRGPTATKDPGVYQMTLTNQYFIFYNMKVHIDSDCRVYKVVGEKEFNTAELAKKQYASLVLKVQAMYSIAPREVTAGKVTEYTFMNGDKITLELDLTASRPLIRLTAEAAS